MFSTNIQEDEDYTPTASPLSFRDVDGSICAPVDVRRCRFMASEPAALPPTRPVGENRELMRLPGTPVVVELRGRVDEAASLGNAEFDLREALCGVPDARFLAHSQPEETQPQHCLRLPFLNNIGL